MNIFKKIKSFFQKKKEQPKKAKELLLSIIEEKKRDPSTKPENLSDTEWKSILKKIASGIECAGKGGILKSPTRKRQRDEKIKKAFELLSVYIKEL